MDILSVLTGAGGSLAATVLSILTYSRLKRNDYAQTGEQQGSILTEIGYIKAGIDDIKREQREQADRHNSLAERVTKVEVLVGTLMKSGKKPQE